MNRHVKQYEFGPSQSVNHVSGNLVTGLDDAPDVLVVPEGPENLLFRPRFRQVRFGAKDVWYVPPNHPPDVGFGLSVHGGLCGYIW
jgi:hypothetical protein